MKASFKCIDLIRKFEGFSAKVYRCPAGVLTIGYGSTRDTDGTPICASQPDITEAQASALMQATLVTYEDAVNRYVTAYINQNQFDALVDFAYNAGAQNLRTSTLLRLLNAKDYEGAANQFEKWVYANGKILNGLVKRRLAEKELFTAA